LNNFFIGELTMNQDQVTAKLSQIQSKNLETAFSLGEAALENTQKLVELNYDASKAALINAQENFQQVITAKDPKALTELLQADNLQEIGNQAIAHQRKVTKVLRESGKEFANVVEASIEQAQAGMQDWVNTLAANAPAGSDVFVSAFKTSMNSVMQGIEQFREASKDALVTVEKSADQAFEAFQSQLSQVKKTAAPAKVRKAA
jgi:phasin family protein